MKNRLINRESEDHPLKTKYICYLSGLGGSASPQSAVVTGPSVEAAQMASQAQIQAAQSAAAAATQNTDQAIQALMGEYTTSMNMTQPIREEGNYAAAQLNYMLGLPAATVGAAPVAPNAPTLKSIEAGINPADIRGYISDNSQLGPFGIYGYTGAGSNVGIGIGQGAGSAGAGNANAWENSVAAGVGGATFAGGDQGQGLQNLESNKAIQQSAAAALAQQQLDNPLSAANTFYNTNKALYDQQLQTYNNATQIYNDYNQRGTAKPSDIANIVTNLPGYQFQMGQGINSIQNAASASGMLNSSNLLEGLNQFGQGLASNYYQNYLNNLSGLAGLGVGATQGAAAQGSNTVNQMAGLQNNLGTQQANSYLAAGQAQASSYLSPAANQQIISQGVGGGNSSAGLLSGVGGLLSGVGSLSGMFSSSRLKTKTSTPSTNEILNRVNELQLDKWKYKGTDAEHIGPYAEEFKELFGVGDGQSINMIDMFGVLIGSVKALTTQVKELQERLK